MTVLHNVLLNVQCVLSKQQSSVLGDSNLIFCYISDKEEEEAAKIMMKMAGRIVWRGGLERVQGFG